MPAFLKMSLVVFKVQLVLSVLPLLSLNGVKAPNKQAVVSINSCSGVLPSLTSQRQT